jgi:MFS family permease
MMAVKSEASMIVLAVLCGFFSGVFIAMPPVCLAALTPNKAMIGTRIGMGFGIISFGLLIGGRGGGGVLGQGQTLNWKGFWTFGGVTACVAGLLYAQVRVNRSGFRLGIKS